MNCDTDRELLCVMLGTQRRLDFDEFVAWRLNSASFWQEMQQIGGQGPRGKTARLDGAALPSEGAAT